MPSRDQHSARRMVIGSIGGGCVLIVVMLLIAAIAVTLEIIKPAEAGRIDLAPWLTLELWGGAAASLLAGYVCRRITGNSRGPLVLAGIVFGLAMLETVALWQQVLAGRVVVPWWLVLPAPFVVAAGILLGGIRAKTLFSFMRAIRLKGVGQRSLPYTAPALVLSAAIGLSLLALPKVPAAQEGYVVATALTLDFTLSFPALVYVLLVRTKRLPWVVLLPTFALGYFLANVTIPGHHGAGLDVVGWLAVPAELAVITYLVVMARRTFKHTESGSGDFATQFRRMARQTLSSRIPADILTTEISILYYAFRHPRRRVQGPGIYTVHREVGYLGVLIGLCMVLIAETLAVHLAVSVLWSSTAAWIITGLSVYALVWLLGDYRALSARPTRVTATHLHLRVGLRWEVDIPLQSLVTVEKLGAMNEARNTGTLRAAVLGSPNLRIVLDRSAVAVGMYGIQKSVQEISLRVDRAADLRAELNGYIESKRNGSSGEGLAANTGIT